MKKSLSNPPLQKFKAFKPESFKKQSGVSLVELLVVIGIVAILFSIGIISIGGLKDKGKLDQISSSVKGAIYQAQTKTINEDYYGVFFEQNRYIIFKGTDYVEGSPDNLVEILPSGYLFISINLSQQKIRFQKISGYVTDFSAPSDLTLQETQTGQSRLISINKLGLVQIQ